MRLPSVGHIVSEARRSFLRFPLVITAAVVSAVLGVIAVDGDSAAVVKAVFTSQLGIPLFFAIACAAENLRWSRAAGLGVGLVGAVLLVLYNAGLPSGFERIAVIRHVQFMVALHLMAAFLPYLFARELGGFWQYNKALFLRFLNSVIFTVVLAIGLIIAVVALDQLLGVPVPEKTYPRLLIVVALVFNTWIFVGGVPGDLRSLDHARDYPRALKVFAQYILIPLVTVYLLILTAYLVKVVVTTQWPSGWIGYLVSSVAAAGILALLLVYPVSHMQENRWVATFSRIFYIMMLPSIAMLLMAIYKRIGQYGVTENRYFLAVLAAWLAGVALYFIFSRRKSIKTIPLSLCVIALVTSFGPWGAYSVSRNSQVDRLRGLLERNGVLVNGVVEKASDGVPREDRREISAILRYVIEVHGTASLDPWFPGGIAQVDTLGGEERAARRQVNERARLITEAMGVAYVERWAPVSDKHFNYSVNYAERIIPLEGAHYLIRLDRFGTTGSGGFGEGYHIAWNADTVSVDLMRVDDLVTRVYVDSLLERVTPEVEQRLDASRVSGEMMTVSSERDGARLVVRFSNLNGTRDDDGSRTVTHFTAECFVTVPEE